jgi:pyruvate dehydrogenase E2 component (dihydrolipoamide acetyltransferase)
MASRVVMPKLTDTMEEGVIIKWYKREGDKVESGDLLAEIETDKAVMDLEAYASGVMRKILAPAESKVPAGALIAVIAREDEDITAILKEPMPVTTPKTIPAPGAAPSAPAPRPVSAGEAVISPRARQMAHEAGLDLATIQGTGPDGLITERDVKAALEKKAPAEAAFEVKEPSTMRRTIARRMTLSKQTAPHFYITMEIDMERAMTLKNQMEGQGTKLTVTDLLIRAAALTLREFPHINAAYVDEKIRYYKGIHIGLAVGLEEGIITPVLREADRKTLTQIASESRELIERAKARKLMPEDYTGSTFSLSNLGMFEVDHFIAIIQPGEGAVLAVGSVREMPVAEGGQMKVGKRMKVTLSCDHRVIDGLQAAQFLQAFKKRLEQGDLS